MLADNMTGKVLPDQSPAHLLLEGLTEGSLLDWDLTILRSLPEAASVMGGRYHPICRVLFCGATYAVYVRAVHRPTGDSKEGWVSCGSFLFPYKAMRLNDQVSLVMP